MPRIVKPLSALAVKSAKPKEKPYKLTDGGGLYLLVNPNGSKLWRMKYRYDGREHTLAFGSWPLVSLQDARMKREEARQKVANGISPAEEKRAMKAIRRAKGATFEAVAQEWLSKNMPVWGKNNTSNIVGILERDIFPCIGQGEIARLKTPDYLEVLQRIERRTIAQAMRARSICRRIQCYAIATGRAEYDVVAPLSKALAPRPPAKHFSAPTEPAKLGRILRMLDSHAGYLSVTSALKILPYVFVRPIELIKAEWKDIDFDKAEWRYFVTKTKTPHIVPLARQVVAILKRIYAVTGGGRWVFTSTNRKTRHIAGGALLAAMRAVGIAQEEASVHGFRAVARTLLDEELGERIDIIEQQLAHTVKDPNGRAYNRTSYLPERKRMMQRWADYLDKLKAQTGMAE
ncbi:MAG: integrase arm-type DNA-binding domain-containing protein [Alistipes senegalensis]|nr:integrase arm-type DNA-binding domain-containing protein [Oxalobacter formigenes]MCM1280737.1 integrase arm-type DNA-binding domain-containing protein [Alistipes senegalensis]